MPMDYCTALHHRPRHSGFTLVELSIVLVIIGLLAGGILAGRSMIRNSQVQSIMTQKESLLQAIQTFKERYNGYPGDLKNATSIWGLAAASNCSTTISTGPETCDGDGNSLIGLMDYGESFRAWQHLSNAGLIPGSYTGAPGATSATHYQPGINMPAGKITSTMWLLYYRGVQQAQPNSFDGSYDHTLTYFARGGEDAEKVTNPLTTDEAWSLDDKYDDGKPARGSIIGYNLDKALSTSPAGNCNTAASSTDLNAKYKLDYKESACALAFVNLF